MPGRRPLMGRKSIYFIVTVCAIIIAQAAVKNMGVAGATATATTPPPAVPEQNNTGNLSLWTHQCVQATVKTLRERFLEDVGDSALTTQGVTFATADIEARLAQASINDELVSRPQTIVWVDRNPEAQRIEILVRDQFGKCAYYYKIGSAKCSTGNPTRPDHFETPVGVFENNPRHPSFRAAGKPNSNGFCGYGKKGLRVWDLGWQQASGRYASGKSGECKIRMMMHSTDAAQGEPLLGTRQSKGCIRIPEKVNRFIDHYRLLDLFYVTEKNYDLIGSDGEPNLVSGALIVVGDSRYKPGATKP